MPLSDKKLSLFIGENPIICLCGSTKFLADFIYWNDRLTKLGAIVHSVGVVLSDKDGDNKELGELLDEVHKQKIGMSQGVFVINPGGYIGRSLVGEIDYAQFLSRDILYTSDYEEPAQDLKTVLLESLCIETDIYFDADISEHLVRLEISR